MNIKGISFVYSATTAKTLGPADIVQDGGDLAQDYGLETAVLISLFSDARSTDKLPSPLSSASGYWGSAVIGFEFGSDRWLLNRSKLTADVAKRSEQIDRKALQWMIDDKIISSVTVTATITGNRQLDTKIIISRPTGSKVVFSYYINWENKVIGGL